MLFFLFITWVVLFKRKGSLGVSVTEHFPADETNIRLEGGMQGWWSLSASLLYIMRECVCDTYTDLPQDSSVSLADRRGEGSTCLSGSAENLE